MQPLNSVGSVGTITCVEPLWLALPFAATNIQWLNAWVVIGLPAIEATESLGTELPHALTRSATPPTAMSAVIGFRIRIGGAW